MKTAELTGVALDWAVCLAQGLQPVLADDKGRLLVQVGTTVQAPSRDWAQGGPIIEREFIATAQWSRGQKTWVAKITHANSSYTAHGPEPLVAAMRAFVASKLGDEVEIPEEVAA